MFDHQIQSEKEVYFGVPCDIFHGAMGTELINKKLLLINTNHSNYNQRGGSVFNKKICFAVQDWDLQTRRKRNWAAANLAKLDFNPQSTSQMESR